MQLEGKRTADDIVIMEMLSAEYGWTPNEIRAQPYDDIKDYIKIINTKRKLENGRVKNTTNFNRGKR